MNFLDFNRSFHFIDVFSFSNLSELRKRVFCVLSVAYDLVVSFCVQFVSLHILLYRNASHHKTICRQHPTISTIKRSTNDFAFVSQRVLKELYLIQFESVSICFFNIQCGRKADRKKKWKSTDVKKAHTIQRACMAYIRQSLIFFAGIIHLIKMHINKTISVRLHI